MANLQNNINYMMVSMLPPNVIINRAYRASPAPPQLEYEGHAAHGTSNSALAWTIRKITYNAGNQAVTERIAHNVAWDDRESLVYA